MASFLVSALLLFPQVADDSMVSIGDSEYLQKFTPDGPIKYLKYPTLGCPEIVPAGKTGRALVKLGDGGVTTDWKISARPTGDPIFDIHTLQVLYQQYDPDLGIYTLFLKIPSNMPDDTYDISLSSQNAAIADEQPNCLRILAHASTEYSFVVLADPQFNDPRGWFQGTRSLSPYPFNPLTIIEQIKKEVRSLKPVCAILCGDVMYGFNYTFEYQSTWKMWKDAGFPIFFAMGNHDGLASTKTRKFLGITSHKKDGFNDWRKTYGPLHFSHALGGQRFLCINSYDGPPERRDSFTFIPANSGGDLLPSQMNWIAGQLEGQTNVVPFMHHHPLGPYKPNQPPSFIPQLALQTILYSFTTGSLNTPPNQWNTQATGEWLRDQLDGKAPYAFVGHNHRDFVKHHGSTTYVGITTCGTSGGSPWGYRLVKVLNGSISSWTYHPAYGMDSTPAGNLFVNWMTANDGNAGMQRARITSGLALPLELTLECYLKTDPLGYAVTNGTLIAQHELPGNVTKLWVTATTPTAPDIHSPSDSIVQIKGNSLPAAVPNPACSPPAGTIISSSRSTLSSYGLTLLLGLLPLLVWRTRRSTGTVTLRAPYGDTAT